MINPAVCRKKSQEESKEQEGRLRRGKNREGGRKKK